MMGLCYIQVVKENTTNYIVCNVINNTGTLHNIYSYYNTDKLQNIYSSNNTDKCYDDKLYYIYSYSDTDKLHNRA